MSNSLDWLPSIKAWLFDLDGTLVDSTPCVEQAWRIWCERHSLDAIEVIHKAHGKRTVDSVKLLAPQSNIEEEIAFLQKLECELSDGLVAIPDAHLLLEEIAALPWAIVTSGANIVATSRLEFTKLPTPSYLICADDVVEGKPHPEGYLMAAKQIGVNPENCVVVEDAVAGVHAGKSAGMKVIAVTTTHTAAELHEADFVCSSLSSLLESIRHFQKA